MFSEILQWDAAVSAALQLLGPYPWNWTWFALTMLGHPIVWFVLAAVLYWNRQENESFFLVNLTVLSLAATGLIKGIVSRPRPNGAYFNITPEPSWLSKISETFVNEFSFPSGHATLAATYAGFYWDRLKKIDQRLLLTASVLLVGLSRVVLGRHFVLDAIAGILLGLVLGQVAVWVTREWYAHHFKLSKIEDAIGVVALVGIALVVMAFVEAPAVLLAVLGYYAGFFLFKELEIRQTPLSLPKQWIKIGFGMGVLTVMAGIAVMALNGFFQLGLFLVSGFWVSFLFPWIVEKSFFKKTAVKKKELDV